MNTEVKILDDLKPEIVFKAGGSNEILEAIKEKVLDFVSDVSTPNGRKEIINRSASIRKSKTFLDNAGKQFKDEYQKIIVPIDAERRNIRDTLDKLAVDVRQPVTDWEAEQKAIALEKKKEAERKEAERLAKIEADKQLLLEQEEEERRKKQAEIDAENDRVKLELEEAQRKIDNHNEMLKRKQDAIDNQNRLDREAIEKEKAELQAEKDAIEQAKIDEANRKEQEKIDKANQEKAIEDAKEFAIEQEREKVAEEKRLADLEENKRKNKELETKQKQEYIDDIEKDALADLMIWVKDESIAQNLLDCIRDGEVKNISINY